MWLKRGNQGQYRLLVFPLPVHKPHRPFWPHSSLIPKQTQSSRATKPQQKLVLRNVACHCGEWQQTNFKEKSQSIKELAHRVQFVFLVTKKQALIAFNLRTLRKDRGVGVGLSHRLAHNEQIDDAAPPTKPKSKC